jgi:predicted RNA polymerase sigma factor
MANPSRRQQIEAMLAGEPDDPVLRYALAMELVGSGENDAAVQCFQELMTRVPDYVPAYLQAGQLLTRLDRQEEARTVYRTGIVMAQKKGDLHAAGEMENFLNLLD